MKRKFVLFIICTALFSACEKEPEISRKDYPIIQTNAVSEIDNEGITLNAEFINKFDLEIKDYGFVWGEEAKPDQNDYIVSLKASGISDQFSIRISSSIKSNRRYYVRAYAVTDKYVLYGNEVTFNGEGCLAPKLNGFSPDSCLLGGDTVKIWGENFSYKLSENIVYIGERQVNVLSRVGDTLYVETPFVIQPVNSKISITVSGDEAISVNDFRMIYPWKKITDFPGSCRDMAMAFTVENKAYVGGGHYEYICKNDFWEYSPATDSWKQIRDFPGTSRFAADCGTSGNNGYVSFGIINYNWERINDGWEYNPPTNSWSAVFRYPESTEYDWYTVVWHKGMYYFLSQSTQSLKVFSENTGWIQKSSSPEPNIFLGISLNDKILYFSAEYIYEYFPETDIWNVVKVLDSWLGGSLGFLINGKIYLVSGWHLLEYDPNLEKFTIKAVLPCEYYYITFALNKELYIGLGGTSLEIYKIHL